MRLRRNWTLALAGAFAISAALAPEAHAAEEGVIGAGTFVSNGAKLSTAAGNSIRGAEDMDDYIFDGITGQSVSFTVKAAGGSALIPQVEVYRPDGTLVEPSSGAKLKPLPGPSLKPSKSFSFSYKLDQTGIWTIRVRGSHVSKTIVDDPGTPDVNEGDDPKTLDDPNTPKIENVETRHAAYDYTVSRTIGEYSIQFKAGAAPGVKLKNQVPDANGQFRFIVPASAGSTFNSTLSWKGGTLSFVSFKTPLGTDVPGVTGSILPKPTSSTVKNYVFPKDAALFPLGSYVLTYQADPNAASSKVGFKATLKTPKAPKPLKGKLATDEPLITGVNPTEGGPTTLLTVNVNRIADANKLTGNARVLLGRFPLESIEVVSSTVIRGRVPGNLPEGTFDVVVESTAGQASVRAQSFKRVPPPVANTIEPTVGTANGGFPVTITGSNFNPTLNGMRIGFQNVADNSEFFPPVDFDESQASDTRLVFTVPNTTPGEYRIKVVDNRTGLSDTVEQTLELTTTASISRVVPGLIPVLGTDTMFVQGANFENGDEVLLEDAPGSDDYTAVATTFIDARKLSFIAPPRAKGVYKVKVRHTPPPPAPVFITVERTFAYYAFADLSPDLALDTTTDKWDGATSAVADFNKDGFDDLFLSRSQTGAARQSTSQTRVLKNDGTGRLVDVTGGASGVMPSLPTDDDWRADRVWATDLTSDGYPDIVICTNSTTVPAAGKSHVRILINEPRASSAADRVFRDRTDELMAPIRQMSTLYGGGTTTTDNWRGLDMWIGDVDLLASGPPEIILTHDETKDDLEVGCAPYCASPYSGGYTYAFHWGGSRAFVWDKAARGGLGRYKFEHNFFPRKSGVTVQIFNPPPGVTIPTCTGTSCRGTFTPFAGQKLAVGFLDGDGKPDVAVLANAITLPNVEGMPSPLQVAINRFDPVGGSALTDLSGGISADPGHAIAIGQPGFPDGNGYGAIATARNTAPANGVAIELLRYKPSNLEGDPGSFEDITSKALPTSSASAGDKFQASAMQFIDIDLDGDQDLILVANAAPAAGESAFRILRNESGLVNGVPSVGVFKETLRPLFVDPVIGLVPAANDAFDGSSLAIGDLDGDGALDFVVTRATTGTGAQTRAIKTDK